MNSANRVLLLQPLTDERLTGRPHNASSIKEHQDSQLKRTSRSGCLHYASKVSLQPNRFICMNLSELTLASVLKLLPNNDVQARVRSHACFFAWARLFVPDKVHSSVSRKNIFRLLTHPLSWCNSAHITTLDQRQSEKNRRHTRSNEHVSVANVNAGSRAEHTLTGTNSANCYEIRKISRPHRSRRYLPVREKYAGPVFVWRYHSLA